MNGQFLFSFFSFNRIRGAERVRGAVLVMDFIRQCWKLLSEYMLPAAFENTVVD